MFEVDSGTVHDEKYSGLHPIQSIIAQLQTTDSLDKI